MHKLKMAALVSVLALSFGTTAAFAYGSDAERCNGGPPLGAEDRSEASAPRGHAAGANRYCADRSDRRYSDDRDGRRSSRDGDYYFDRDGRRVSAREGDSYYDRDGRRIDSGRSSY